MAKRKAWCQKLHDSKDLPKVIKIDGKMSRKWGSGTVAIPSPLEVDELMRKARKGRLATINLIREAIARKHGATIGCPICCGIFAWVSAHAAEEDVANNARSITPYWRTLKNDGQLNEKYPGGAAMQARRLRAEGHTIEQRGKRMFVMAYETKLAKF